MAALLGTDGTHLIGEPTHATAWCFDSSDVGYVEHLPPVDHLARPAGVIGLACLVRNRRVREEARALARLQWHAVGSTTVTVAGDRLLLALDGETVSLWFDDDFELFATPRQDQLCAATAIEGPYLLQGPAIPYIDGLLAQVVDAEPVEPMPTTAPAWSPLPAEPPPTCGRRGVTVGRRGRWSLAGWRA